MSWLKIECFKTDLKEFFFVVEKNVQITTHSTNPKMG